MLLDYKQKVHGPTWGVGVSGLKRGREGRTDC